MNTTNPFIFEPLTINHAFIIDESKDSSGAIFPSRKLTDRKTSRKYIKQAEKAVSLLMPIVEQFNRAVLYSDPSISYMTIFAHYAKEWKEACRILASKKLKTVVVDSHWFVEQYIPKVKA